jgi:catechol 2,3-dioxygenase-like lactoylglutathione lyase family enzyme
VPSCGAITKGVRTVDFKYEVTVLPVSDVDRAKAFYADTLGWTVDVDHRAGDSLRVVQLTPPGSARSISIGTGISPAAPGSYQGMHLVVSDIEAARAKLAGRGVEVSEPFHFGAEGQTPGLHPERADYGTYLSFSDPDGNGWLVQEVRQRAPGR